MSTTVTRRHPIPPDARPPRRPLLAAALVATLGLVAGCSSEPPDQRPATAVIGTPSDFENVNELIATGSDFNDTIVHQLFVSLLEEQPDFEKGPPTLKPFLATAWELSEDRLVLTFHLRNDVRWSDGTPVTADDVRFTWQAQTSPGVAWVYGFVKEPISDVEVVDPYTVRFHFHRAYATQLLDANEGMILPKHVWEKLPFERWREQPGWFQEHLVSAGPFLLESWEPQVQLLLERNPDYFETGLPRLDGVLFRQSREPSALLAQLLSGELDMVPSVRPADAERVKHDPTLRLVAYPTRQYTFITWNITNQEHHLFEEPEVRRALAHAVDRQAIIDTLWYGYAKVASSPVISSVWAHDPAVRPLRYDPALARRLLERNGWRDTDGDGILDKNGVKFSFVLSTNPGNQLRWDAMQMIQSQLRAVGIDARPERLEYKKLNALNLAHKYDATVTAFSIDTSLDLTYAFHTKAIDDGYNFGGYSNPEVDKLIEQANAVLDQRDALPMLYKLQEILARDQPFLFLWEPYRLLAHRADLQGVQPNALSEYFHLREWRRGQPGDEQEGGGVPVTTGADSSVGGAESPAAPPD